MRALAAEAGDTDLLLVTYINESDGLLVDGCFAEAASLARAGQRIAAQRGGKLDHHDLLLINLVCALIATGDWAEAEALLDDALLVDRPGALRANVHGFLAEVRLARGDLAGAEQAADEAHRRLAACAPTRRAIRRSPPSAVMWRLPGDGPRRPWRSSGACMTRYGDSVAYPSMVWPALHVAARAVARPGPAGGKRPADATEWLREAAAQQRERQDLPWWTDDVRSRALGR